MVKLNGDIEFSGYLDQVTVRVYLRNKSGYLSPGNSIDLKIAVALLFISVTILGAHFVETQARPQQTCLFSLLMHALRAYRHHEHSYNPAT